MNPLLIFIYGVIYCAPGFAILSWNMSDKRKEPTVPVNNTAAMMLIFLWPVFVVIGIVSIVIDALRAKEDA